MGISKDEPFFVVDGKPFVALGGEVHNSSSSDSATMEKAFAKAEELGLNTIAAPVTWELLEPEEGVFDFTQTDSLLAQAREHGMHLILLWFGTWKNAQGFYAPAWVKKDPARFWRAEPIRGKRQIMIERYHAVYGTMSALCDETMAADARAFAALMKHLKEADGEEHTVIAVQVENECGLMVAAREHSEAADELFATELVPCELISALKESKGLPQDVQDIVDECGEGSWKEAFGENAVADELFQAWHTARYVEQVAEAGKAVHSLPMLVNCWLDKGKPAGAYPTGGPVFRMFPVWKVAAPSIDMVCPDIYVRSFCEICDTYHTADNPLAIVETATHSYLGPRAIWAVCHHHAPVFAPFGFEEMGEPFTATQGFLFGMDVSDPALSTPQSCEAYRKTMECLCGMLEAKEAWGGTLDAVIAEQGLAQELRFGDVVLKVQFAEKVPGAVAVLPLGWNEKEGVADALILASGAHLSFVSADDGRPCADVLALEEGTLEDGCWKRGRRLNGDELQILSVDEPALLRASVFLYA